MNNKNLTYPRYFLFTLILVTIFSSHLPTASAQEPEGPTETPEEVSCGSIVAPAEWESDLWLENPIESVPITDCALPFGDINEWEPGERKMKFTIAGSLVEDGGIFIFTDSRTKDYDFEYNFLSDYSTYGHVIFRHQDNDYEFVDGRSVPLTDTDYRELAIEFGVSEEIVGEYVSRQTSDDPYEGLVYGTPEYQSFDEYDSFVYIEAQKNYPYLETGTYTIVYHLYERESAWDEAYLASRHADTFTITGEEIEPLGASSVLFLPGMQASRLYTDGAMSEDQIWEPNYNSDVLDLVMSNSGNSVKDIYTRDVIDEVVIPFIGGNIYKGFLKMLEDMEDEEIIAEYTAFAYDWRYDVKNIADNGTKYRGGVRDLVNDVVLLARGSNTGKVTIIGHSNGGLLAKALIARLETLGLDDLVDKVIFIGTPHLGTPKAIGTMLHGYDQQKLGGLFIDDEDARYAMNNMPGAYGLLPSAKYLSKMDEPLVTFARGSSTQSFTDSYGESIDEMEDYINFLLGVDGRESDYFDISKPVVANVGILKNAVDLHDNYLDNWVDPEGVEVFNIVGVGLPTMKTIEYRNLQENRRCSVTIFGQTICEDIEYFYRPYAHFTAYGDETVTSLSSDAVEGNVFYFDINSYNDNLLNPFLSYEHADLTEIDIIQTLVSNIIHSTTTEENYVYSNSPSFIVEYEVLAIDSPVRIYKIDSEGNQTGLVKVGGEVVLKQEIPNSQYFEFAGTKYLISPVGDTAKVVMEGEDYGGYTLTVAKLTSEDKQIIEREIINATTTPNMVSSFTVGGGEYSDIQTDLDGDGVADYIYGWNGHISEIYEEQEDKEFKDINGEEKRNSSGTKIKNFEPVGLVLGVSTITELNENQRRLYLLLQELSTLLTKWRSLGEI